MSLSIPSRMLHIICVLVIVKYNIFFQFLLGCFYAPRGGVGSGLHFFTPLSIPSRMLQGCLGLTNDDLKETLSIPSRMLPLTIRDSENQNLHLNFQFLLGCFCKSELMWATEFPFQFLLGCFVETIELDSRYDYPTTFNSF